MNNNHINKNVNSLSNANKNIFMEYAIPMQDLKIARIFDLLSMEVPGSILDLGCADGQFCEYLSRSNWDPVGIDINKVSDNLSSRRNIKMVVGNFSNPLPFKSESFNAVVGMEIIEHLIDTRFFLSECFRVLRRNGCLLLTTPNLVRLENRIRLFFGRYPLWMDYELENGIGHVRYYTGKVLKKQIKSVGFNIEQHIGTTMGLPLLSRFINLDNNRILNAFGMLLPSLAANIVVKARKI